MAGLGSRFQSAGFTVAKPLIEVRGRPMYSWAADSLPLQYCTRLIFVLLATQPDFKQLQDDILHRYAKFKPTVQTVPEVTAGQSITVLSVKELIDSAEPLLIHNADTAFEIAPGWVQSAFSDGVDGGLLVFRSSEPRWSYSREDSSGWVVEVREKQVVSPWASTGTYWFRRGADFVRLAETRAQQGQRDAGEYYVGPLYNDLIARGGRVKNYAIQRLFCFGTPEDLQATLAQLEGAPPTDSRVNPPQRP
jgi:UDP-N-acetylglucosamine diphosphorylase / glucose-1-phosphate thymidylyltransferase / UDP-N-acetylgalactosamine diphosphorylase / glucosamine-1-phosphate N-acetyltransferase / galactosamine-1-phosphate N-acetyltransferase